MSLKGIISISGMPGLFKVLAQTKSGFIVESLQDKKRMPVSSTQRISMLEDISVYTNTDDLPLKEVMLKLIDHAEKSPLIDPKSDPIKLRDFFKKVVPEYDAERVYPSDIKKIITWFELVKDFVTIADEPEEKTEAETASEEVAEEVETVSKKPKAETVTASKKKTKAASKESEAKEEAAPKASKPRKKSASK